MAKKVAIYTTATCTYCRQAKEFFKANSIAYDEYNVGTDAARREEMVEKSGQMGVPVISVSGDDGEESVIVGFNKDALTNALSE